MGLRMLAVHIDDGLDNPIATENIHKLIDKTNTELILIHPNHEEYADLLKSLFKASVPGLAIVQDNLILKAVDQYGRDKKIKFSLDGNNIAHESILQKGDAINAADKKYILTIQKEFGEVPIKETEFISLIDRYIKRSFSSKIKHIRPLNFLNYNLEVAIQELHNFCGFEYYGGKHYESILCRFLQCYYLPHKFGIDKRRSHYSSLIMSGQLTREAALKKLDEPLYASQELLNSDKKFLADFMNITVEELENYIAQPPKSEMEYGHSILNDFAPLARKFRRIIE